MGPSVKPEKRQDVNIKAITHGFVLLIINLKKLHIWVHLCQLTYLHRATTHPNLLKTRNMKYPYQTRV